MSRKSEPRTRFDEIPFEALLHMSHYTMRSYTGRKRWLDLAAKENFCPSHGGLVYLADKRHPLHDAAVELVDELVLHSPTFFPPAEAMPPLFVVLGQRCSCLTVKGCFELYPARFWRVLNTYRHLKS